MARSELARQILLESLVLMWAVACTGARVDQPTATAYPTRTPIASTLTPTFAPSETATTTATPILATALASATLFPTPTETENPKPPFISGQIDLSQDFIATSPDGEVQVVALPQRISDAWSKTDIDNFNNLLIDKNRRSWLILKTDLPGITMVICHSFWFNREPLPCNWMAKLGVEKVIEAMMSLSQNGIDQMYKAIASINLSENLVSPRLNDEAYRQQAGGIYADTVKMGVPQEIRKLIANRPVIIAVVCQGDFYTDAEGHQVLPDRQLVFFEKQK